MKINKFIIQHKNSFDAKEISFASLVNIIYSEKNSTGKTTLLRAILYTLGFPIPSTNPIRFEDFEFCLEVICADITYYVSRKAGLLTINEHEFDLPVEQRNAQIFLFGINNAELLYNLLGTIYFDQENGWTLLNRGQVIGGNRFNVESFFRGLKDDESDESYQMVAEINALNKKITQYKLMLNVAEYQASLSQDVEQRLDYQTYQQSLDTSLLEKQAQLQRLESELARLSDVMKKNKQFSEYIEMKNVYVKVSDDSPPIRVTKETLFNYEEVEDVNSARRSILLADRNALKRQIAEIEVSQGKQLTLDNLPKPEDEVVRRLANIQGISSVEVGSMLNRYHKEKQRISNALINRTKNNNPWISEAYNIISTYAKELDLPSNYRINVFTKDKKTKSGAILHKMVFIYKLAFIKLLSKKVGYAIPIFCDSPSGREVRAETISAMMGILKRDFSEHQIFISSIHKFDDIYSDANIFIADGTLFDESNLSDFFPEQFNKDG